MKPITNFVALDVETTGLDFDSESIIELAAVRFEAGEAAATFQAFFPAVKSLTAMARLLTGLNEETLRAAPPPAETLRAFLEFAGDAPLVAHNADFDATFLRRALERENLPLPAGTWLDSLLLARTAWPDWESHRLEFLADRLKLDPDSAHRALPDARRAGGLFLKAQERLAALPASGQEALARLTAGLPGWGAFFAVDAPSGSIETPELPRSETPPAAPAPATGEVASEDETRWIPGAVAALEGDGWLIWETDPRREDAEAALQIAWKLAEARRRVIVAVPGAAWKVLRAKYAGAAAGKKTVALGEPQGYLCRRRWNEVLADADRRLSPEERRLATPLAVWADGFSGSWLGDCRGFSAARAKRLAVFVQCDAYDDDPGACVARSDAESAGVILVTHETLFAHLRLEGALLPSGDAVIVAGAQALPESALLGFGCAVSFFRLRSILQLWRWSSTQSFGIGAMLEAASGAVPAPEDWFEPERQLQRFLQKLGKAAKRRMPNGSKMRYAGPVALAFDVNPEPVLQSLKDQEEGLRSRADAHPSENARRDAVRIADRLRDFRLDFERLCAAKEPGVYWVEEVSNPHKAVLRWAPEELGPVFGVPLRNWYRSGALLSPAMALADGGTRFFSRMLGWPSMRKAESSSTLLSDAAAPTPTPTPTPFLLAPFVPVPAAMDSAAAFAEFLATAVAPFAGVGFWVFLPSFGVLRAVHAALLAAPVPGRAVWAQHVDGGRDALLRLFASASGGLILATEGIEGLRDATGNSPAIAVVARMPLPSARDPWLEAWGERLRGEGKNARHELWQPTAVLRLKREVAALRDAGSLKTFWCLDSRAASEGLGAFAARALRCAPCSVPDLAALQAATLRALEIPRP